MNAKKQTLEKPLDKSLQNSKKPSLSSFSNGSDLSGVSSLNSISQEWLLETKTPRESLKIEDNDCNNQNTNNMNPDLYNYRQNSNSDEEIDVVMDKHSQPIPNLHKVSIENNIITTNENLKNSTNAKTKNDIQKKKIKMKSQSSKSLSSTISLFSESDKRNNSLLFFETHGIKANLANMSYSSIYDDEEKSDDCENLEKNNKENFKIGNQSNKKKNNRSSNNKNDHKLDVDAHEKNNKSNKKTAKKISKTQNRDVKTEKMKVDKNDKNTTVVNDSVTIQIQKSNKNKCKTVNNNTSKKINVKNMINRFQNNNHTEKTNTKGKRNKKKHANKNNK